MKKKILIIEDEENIAQMEGMILNDTYELYFADNGIDGLELARKVRPALVVLDLMLPKMDGYEVCKRLKSDPLTKNVKVVIVTARKTQQDQKKGFLLGTDEYLTKPFEPDELYAIVKQKIG